MGHSMVQSKFPETVPEEAQTLDSLDKNLKTMDLGITEEQRPTHTQRQIKLTMQALPDTPNLAQTSSGALSFLRRSIGKSGHQFSFILSLTAIPNHPSTLSLMS